METEVTTTTVPPLPTLFYDRLREIVPSAEFEAVLATFTHPKPVTFRVNTLKTTIETCRASLEAQGLTLSTIDWYDNAFAIPHDQKRALTESAEFNQGHLYVQNLASMTAPLALAPEAGETILDLAAAPGGKTTQLANLMHNHGNIKAVEIVKDRYYRLKANLAQQGTTIVQPHLMDGRAVGNRWPALFDRVLLDAPCSSEGRFTQLDPSSWQHWNLRKVQECSHKQKRLLQAAIHTLKKGGKLLYCTCSFAPEENEVVIHHILRKFGDEIEIRPIPLDLPRTQHGLTTWGKKTLHPDLIHATRLLPTEMRDGFFLCLLAKK